MKTSNIVLLSILGFFIFTGLYIIGTGNGLVAKEEAVNSAYSQVQNVYQRRLDLIPNLVETVKGYASHEKETLTAVAQARNQATKVTLPANATPEQLKAYQDAQVGLGNALSRLLAVSEKYPELKANENFMDLQKQLEGTENRIAVERKVFNDTTQSYNYAVKSFPTSIIAGFKGLTTKPYFEADAQAKTAPKVKF